MLHTMVFSPIRTGLRGSARHKGYALMRGLAGLVKHAVPAPLDQVARRAVWWS